MGEVVPECFEGRGCQLGGPKAAGACGLSPRRGEPRTLPPPAIRGPRGGSGCCWRGRPFPPRHLPCCASETGRNADVSEGDGRSHQPCGPGGLGTVVPSVCPSSPAAPGGVGDRGPIYPSVQPQPCSLQ